MNRPGVKTTEFWLTLALVLVSALVALGFVSPVDRAGLETDLAKIIEAIAAIFVSGAAIWRYIAAREQVKLAEADPETISKGA